jgi:nifR3 family TIM-barrel protein
MNPVAEILARNPIVLAPMAGVTEAPFRAICKRFGAGLTYTEMVSAKGLHYNRDSEQSRALLSLAPEEVPCAVQLFGSEPDLMAEQGARLCEELAPDVALIDVNMGCPVAKVVAKGEGSALMRDPEIAAAIVEKLVAACPVPVTVKIRSGWDAHSVNAVDFARRMEAAGASAIAVHGRTRNQFYHGRADWDLIAQVKHAVDVPVLGSGDVMTAEDAIAMLDRTGCEAAMVARGAQGNPWLFERTRALLAGEPAPAPPTAFERIAIAREHARGLVVHAGDRAHVRMRKHIAWYLAGVPGATYVRARVYQCESIEALEALLDEYEEYLRSRPPASTRASAVRELG